jgi:hypothetical protein
VRRALLTCIVALSALPALAGGFNVNYLVPAFVPCPGPDTCGAPERESRFTFDTAIVRAPRGKYTNPSKPSLFIELRGVKDEGGAPVTSNGFTAHVSAGQVNILSLGLTIPPGHPLSQVAPFTIPLRNGNSRRVPYKPSAQPPSGTTAEGGAITVYDSDGKRLATIGAQYK